MTDQSGLPQRTHTPGPWSFDGPRNNIHVRQASDPDMRVCFMTSNGPTRENARLIAAAPEMLEALKLARERIPGEFDFDHTDRDDEVMRVVQEVIAKAEGRIP